MWATRNPYIVDEKISYKWSIIEKTENPRSRQPSFWSIDSTAVHVHSDPDIVADSHYTENISIFHAYARKNNMLILKIDHRLPSRGQRL